MTGDDADQLIVRPTKVLDGDTFEAEIIRAHPRNRAQYETLLRVRVHAIDTPHPLIVAEGAKASLEQLLLGHDFVLTVIERDTAQCIVGAVQRAPNT